MITKVLRYLKRDPLLLIVILLALWSGHWLLKPGYFNMHDDLQLMRQLAMEECFRDGQIPCRWTPHMGYGFGFPLFNYYPPLPYLIGQVIRIAGFSFITTAKLVFLLSMLVSGVTMYILAREFWGRLGGLISASFYIWAPYHSVDVFVRGAGNEAWALAWFPLILWSSYKLITKARFRWIVLLALSWFALFTSHNLMVMIFIPLFGIWLLFWLWRKRSWFTILHLTISGIWAFGLAAFFTLPVFLEKELVHVETLVVGYYEYIAHFANINQILFSRFWDYGPSVWMAQDDRMSFQVGHLHWILSLVVLIFVVIRYLKTKKIDNLSLIALFFIAAGWFASFMAHQRSTFIWLSLPFLKFVQFPWRFLTLAILAFSFAAGAIVAFLPIKSKNQINLVVLVLITGVIWLNKDYFQPEAVGPLTDEEKFSGAAWDLQQTAGIYDYLPKGAYTAPKAPQDGVAKIIEGEGEVLEQWQNTNSAAFKVRIDSLEAVVQIGIFEFPDWRVFINGEQTETFIGEDHWGRMHINLSQGEYNVTAKLYNTAPRIAGNTISAISWLALLTVPVWRKKKA